jgi:hypothetical protein
MSASNKGLALKNPAYDGPSVDNTVCNICLG